MQQIGTSRIVVIVLLTAVLGIYTNCSQSTYGVTPEAPSSLYTGFELPASTR